MIFTIWILTTLTSATCMMCTENTANMACVPCGHMLACENCQIPSGSSCPVCRDIVTQSIRISRTGGSIFQNPTQAVQTENMGTSVETQTESVVQSLSETSTSAEVPKLYRIIIFCSKVAIQDILVEFEAPTNIMGKTYI